MEESGHLYWDSFSGWYSCADEAFYADWEVDQSTKTAKETGASVEWVEEETCKFRLGAFKERLHQWLESGGTFTCFTRFFSNQLNFIGCGMRISQEKTI